MQACLVRCQLNRVGQLDHFLCLHRAQRLPRHDRLLTIAVFLRQAAIIVRVRLRILALVRLEDPYWSLGNFRAVNLEVSRILIVFKVGWDRRDRCTLFLFRVADRAQGHFIFPFRTREILRDEA